jgi:WD40 repeat protein
MSKVIKELQRREIFFCIARELENHQFFVGASDGRVYRVMPECEPPVFLGMDGHRGYVTGIVCARGQVISAAYDGSLIWWDSREGQPRRKVPAHARWIRGLALSPDESWCASVGDDMVCRIWDTESGLLRRELAGHAPRTPQHFPSMLFAVSFARVCEWFCYCV